MRLSSRLALQLCILSPLLIASGDGLPWRFHFDQPLPRWKDGLPVGNGRLGAQVWGTGPELYLTIDRGDVWDLRYEENHGQSFSYSRLRELVKQRRRDLIQKEMTPDVGPLNDLTPTRISIGRIRIMLPKNTTVRWSELDM